jgi:hypothetical protein
MEDHLKGRECHEKLVFIQITACSILCLEELVVRLLTA